jgi:hypothetical protein
MRIATRRPIRSAVIALTFLGLTNALILPGSAARRTDAHSGDPTPNALRDWKRSWGQPQLIE